MNYESTLELNKIEGEDEGQKRRRLARAIQERLNEDEILRREVFSLGVNDVSHTATSYEAEISRLENLVADYEAEEKSYEAEISRLKNLVADYEAEEDSYEAEISRLENLVADYEAEEENSDGQG